MAGGRRPVLGVLLQREALRLQIIEQEPAALAGDDGMDRVAEGRLAGIASASSVVGSHRCVISVKFGWRGFFVAVFHEGDGGGQPRLDGIAHGGMPEGDADDGKDVLRQAQKRRNLCDAVSDPSDEAAAEPETVTIKATPDSGYQLDKMTVKDKNNSTVKLKKVDDNEYTFTMPVGKVSVDATFVQKDAADDSNAAEAGKTIKLQIGSRIVNVDNEAVIYDAAPVIRNDRTLVPIRIITEALGGKVDWNGAAKEVTLSINDKEIKMTIGKMLEKYGVAPVIIDGRTFVPVRFVADELGANVVWDDATKTVTIKTAR